MHFWIDKRSQCGYSGRRMPSSLSAGVGRTRRDRHLKPMVTPVHRFQSVECVAGSARRPPGGQLHRSPAPSIASHALHRPAPRIPVYSTVNVGNHTSGGGVELDSSVYLDVGAAEASAGGPALHGPLPPHILPTHLKCGIWASFVLATIFVAGAKFYFEHQVVYNQVGVEVLWVCALLVLFLLSVCTASLCRARLPPGPPLPPLLAPPIPEPPSQDSSEDLALGTMLSLQQAATAAAGPMPPSPPPPPPPYHIALLLPPREAPPPSYEKAVS